MRIVISAIAKNEAKHVDRWLAALKDADDIYVLDTGSTDDTVALLKAGGAYVRTVAYKDFAFDTARNDALRMIPRNPNTFVFMLDLDEVVRPGWYEQLQEWAAIITAQETGRVTVVSSGYRFMRNCFMNSLSPASYRYSCHEVLRGAPYRDIPNVVVDHFPDTEKERDYLPLLQQDALRHQDARTFRYLVRELLRTTDWRMVPHYIEKAMELETDPIYLAELWTYQGTIQQDTELKMDCYRNAAVCAGRVRQFWGQYAYAALRNERWLELLSASTFMQFCRDLPSHLVQETLYTDVWVHHMIGMAHQRLGNPIKSIEHLRVAQTIEVHTGQPPSNSLIRDIAYVESILP